MKKIFCAILALAAMASCSNEDTIEYNKQAIAFGEAFVENSTRATDLTYTDTNKVTEFKVYGTVQGTHSGSTPVFIFNGDDVKNTDGTNTVGYDGGWFCNNIQYWVPNANYLFTAVVDGEFYTANNKIAYTVSSQKDLLLAAATASVNNNGVVTGVDGNVILFGVNIFNYPWNFVKKEIIKDKTIDIYSVKIDDSDYIFGALEVSNCVWEFYVFKY